MPIRELFRSVAHPLLDFFYPPLCLSCNGRLEEAERFLCAPCCRRLVRVQPSDRTMRVLASRFAPSGAVSNFLPLYYFEEDGVLQHAVHALKYGQLTAVGEWFGEDLGRALATCDESFTKIDLILPVPLHLQKERERGYNQSDFICKGIARALPLVPVERRMLRRVKNTRTQTKLTVLERTRNVSGAFAVEPEGRLRLRNRTVLLVDDVVTTGATIQACAEALQEAGALHVLCASIGAAKLEEDD